MKGGCDLLAERLPLHFCLFLSSIGASQGERLRSSQVGSNKASKQYLYTDRNHALYYSIAAKTIEQSRYTRLEQSQGFTRLDARNDALHERRT